MSDCSQILKKRIAQLEAELRAVRRQVKAQRQRIADKYGDEFLALIDGAPDTKVTVTADGVTTKVKAVCNGT